MEASHWPSVEMVSRVIRGVGASGASDEEPKGFGDGEREFDVLGPSSSPDSDPDSPSDSPVSLSLALVPFTTFPFGIGLKALPPYIASRLRW